MKLKCIECQEIREVHEDRLVFHPAKITMVGYYLDCPKCKSNTFHKIIHDTVKNNFGVSDLSRFKKQKDDK